MECKNIKLIKEEYLKIIDKIIKKNTNKIVLFDDITNIAHNIYLEASNEINSNEFNKIPLHNVIQYIIDILGYSEYYWVIETNYKKLK